ncbi:MAG: uracil phosphoribosyltransferase, partial [Ruminococcaceae bacterium]|nr:uracil phosphoribosyltransferase [Oscillospiraceae bacterium]
MKNVTIFDHPLIQHKTTIMRMKSTSNKEFRESVEEITMLMCYEALRDLPVEAIDIETPIGPTRQNVIKGKKLAVVPILRAGLGMVNGLLNLVPSAKVGHIGMYRDEETLQPHPYYCKLPADILTGR